MNSTYKTVLEAYYNDHKDVEVTVNSDGIIFVDLLDPAGNEDLCLGYSFGPAGCKQAVSNHYNTLQEAVDLIEFEVKVAPQIRRDILQTLGYEV